MVTPNIDALRARLAGKKLRLLFAAESGSRAWGFASPDSDYDVRFVFVRSVESYLGLHESLTQIDYKEGLDDISGWDLRKTLLLAQKSNPSLIEWLKSPIVYHDESAFRTWLLTLVQMHFNPRGLVHHYVNFMRNIRGKYLEDWTGEYTLKRYFYALRPIFVIMWMLDNPGQLAPIEFERTSDAVCPTELRPIVADLLTRKRASNEKIVGQKIPELDSFVATWYEQGHDVANNFPVRQFPIEVLDNMFLELSGFRAGWSSPVAHQAHNLKIASSNLAPASIDEKSGCGVRAWQKSAR